MAGELPHPGAEAAAGASRRVTIRRFEPGDLRRILAIEADGFGKYAWPAELFREYYEEAPELFLVAPAGRTLAGYVIATMWRGGAEIDSIAVHSRYQGQGFGLALFRAAKRRVAARGARAIWLMVRPDNTRAIEFYRRLGFVRVGSVARYYEDESPGWRLRLKLDG